MHPVVGVHEVWALRERVRACAEPPRATLSASWGARSVRAESPPPPSYCCHYPCPYCTTRSVRAERRGDGAAGARGRRCRYPPPRLPSLLLPLPMSPLYT